ncbi:MAG TPA: ectoine/hydroxyectoine ABC transporter permease subunit EhuD [Candidatus Limnocylindrales bacterium]|jgi:polar amino acid transport system permease protein
MTDLERILGYLPDLWGGLQLTVFLTFTGMSLALVIGLVIALARLDPRRKFLTWPARAFVEIIRGTPLLLQLFYIFYVLPSFGIRLDRLVAGILGLGLNTGAYLSEVFRSGIDAVQKGQWEAADALGMPTGLTLRHIVLPQALRIVIPPVGNYFISMFKDTALVATISVPELLFSGQLLAAQSFRYLEIYSLIFVMYLVISYPASLGVRWIERRLRISTR